MKKLLLVIILLIVCVGLFLGLCLLPQHFYAKGINEGMDSNFLRISKPSASLLKGQDYKMARMPGLHSENLSMWNELHIQNFSFLVPAGHPGYLLVPLINKVDNQNFNLGISYLSQSEREFASIEFLKPTRVKFKIGKDKLFNLPIFKNKLAKHLPRENFKNLFLKEIKEGKFSMNQIKSQSDSLFDFSFVQELVYNLFIVQKREELFSSYGELESISYVNDHDIGALGVSSNNDSVVDNFTEEVFMVYESGVLYPFKIRARKDYLPAESLRKKILKTIKYKKTSNEDSLGAYSTFQRLGYREKVQQIGLMYLFSSWSHSLNDRTFLKRMITILERGDLPKVQLEAFYKFGFSRFGSSFSTRESSIIESADALLQRKIGEELEKEIDEIKEEGIELIDGQFSSQKERVQFLLNKAKKAKKSNSDESLILE